MKIKTPILSLLFSIFFTFKAGANCRAGCDLAFASYYVWEGCNLTYISQTFDLKISEILSYNPDIPNQDSIRSGSRIRVPFRCDCLNGDFLGHRFDYRTRIGDTYSRVAREVFANLTTEDWVQRVNRFDPTQIPDFATINVTVNCSCGDRRVSADYGLFETYSLREGDNLTEVAAETGVAPELLRRFNLGSDFGAGSGLVFVPARGTCHFVFY